MPVRTCGARGDMRVRSDQQARAAHPVVCLTSESFPWEPLAAAREGARGRSQAQIERRDGDEFAQLAPTALAAAQAGGRQIRQTRAC
jgi:hypothetical protein